MMEESLEPLEESNDESQEYFRVMDENHLQVQELLERAAELVAEMQKNRARTEKPC